MLATSTGCDALFVIAAQLLEFLDLS